MGCCCCCYCRGGLEATVARAGDQALVCGFEFWQTRTGGIVRRDEGIEWGGLLVISLAQALRYRSGYTWAV